VLGQRFVDLNGGPNFKPHEEVSFMIVTEDQAETDRNWSAIVDNGGEESACGWCKDRRGFSWQITPRVLLDATASPDTAAAKRAFDAMIPMRKIDVATIEAAFRGETVDAYADRRLLRETNAVTAPCGSRPRYEQRAIVSCASASAFEPIRPPLYRNRLDARFKTSGLPTRLPMRDCGGGDGAFMEQSGRNQSQPVASGTARGRLKQAKTVAAGCDQLPIGAHGKEGVDGSSPSEGFAKAPANSHFACLGCKRLSHAGTRGVSAMFARGSHAYAEVGLTKLF